MYAMIDEKWSGGQELAVEYEALTILEAELRATLGYGDAAPGADIQAIIDRIGAQVRERCRPRLGLRIVEGSATGERLVLGDAEFAPGRIIVHRLRKGIRFAVLVASVGEAMDDWLHALRGGSDVVEAFVADAWGSVTAEAVVAYGLERLAQLASHEGLRITNSYSPGYCGWDVAEQHKLFALLPPAFCGVTLCASGLMLPIKSVSAVVGIGPEAERHDYGCALCRKQDCYKYRAKH